MGKSEYALFRFDFVRAKKCFHLANSRTFLNDIAKINKSHSYSREQYLKLVFAYI